MKNIKTAEKTHPLGTKNKTIDELSWEEYVQSRDNGWNYRNGHNWIACDCESCVELLEHSVHCGGW